METTLNNKSAFLLSQKKGELIFDLITFVFIMLFVYTAASKIMTFGTFKEVLGKSPLIGNFNVLIAYTIPTVEIILSVLLLIERTKRTGLLLSSLLMVLFTSYLIYMISLNVPLPCQCGGVISLLTWKQHIILNGGLIALAFAGLKLYKSKK